MVADSASLTASSNPGELRLVGSVLYFAANDGLHGRELWQTPFNALLPLIVK
jgi:hypothetical protein